MLLITQFVNNNLFHFHINIAFISLGLYRKINKFIPCKQQEEVLLRFASEANNIITEIYILFAIDKCTDSFFLPFQPKLLYPI